MSAADPGMFATTARTGWHATTRIGEPPVDPPEPRDDYEPVAPYCDGPGPVYGHVGPGYYCYADPDTPWFLGYVNPPEPLVGIVDRCPSCVGLVRNHRSFRLAVAACQAEVDEEAV